MISEFFFTIYLFIWLCQVLVAARRLFVAVRGLPRCGTQALEHAGLVAPLTCGFLVPRPGIEPASPALEGRFLTTRPPGKS